MSAFDYMARGNYAGRKAGCHKGSLRVWHGIASPDEMLSRHIQEKALSEKQTCNVGALLAIGLTESLAPFAEFHPSLHRYIAI